MAYSLELKDQLDMRLLPWPRVTSKEMFGSICYLYQNRMFAIIQDDSLVTKLPLADRERAITDHGAAEFTIGAGRSFGQWTRFQVASPPKVDDVISWIEMGYSYVKSLPPSRAKRRKRVSGTGGK